MHLPLLGKGTLHIQCHSGQFWLWINFNPQHLPVMHVTEGSRTALPVTGSFMGVGEIEWIEWVFYRSDGRIEGVFILGTREEKLWVWLAQA